jgi:hypothetical protein
MLTNYLFRHQALVVRGSGKGSLREFSFGYKSPETRNEFIPFSEKEG